MLQYKKKMHFNILPTFKKNKGSIINNRYIWNKITSFQTTLGAEILSFWYKIYA